MNKNHYPSFPKYTLDILAAIKTTGTTNQRALASMTGYSLGNVNKSINTLLEAVYIHKDGTLTEQASAFLAHRKPQNALILAAGFGLRMIPISNEISKGLLEVNGEPLVERLIKQLHAVGIQEIHIVVGYMKEQYEYLMDLYDVDLIVNRDYATRNNAYSLYLAENHIHNTYIIPCDIWCRENPFSRDEFYPWYMTSEELTKDSDVRINSKNQLVRIAEEAEGNRMVGIAYITEDVADDLKTKLEAINHNQNCSNWFWEEALYTKDRLQVYPRLVKSDFCREINTFEDLRELDCHSNQLKNDPFTIISETLSIPTEDIFDIQMLKTGMTNRSFLFKANGQKYIMRIPGEGTDNLINRREEAEVYAAIRPHAISDDVLYINPTNGYKITAFLEKARVCDPEAEEDLKKCMAKLREFHSMNLSVPHTFDIFGQIEFYESLWKGKPSVYRDYPTTKANVLSLRSYIESHREQWCLTHIDAVPDNFLFYQKDGKEDLRLIDWEYAGMQDPHVDIAMFIIYALYDRKQADALIDIYFEGSCPKETRTKIYCLIAACGLLWSNWCEYKRSLGVDFGEYSIRQYRYAKDYYRLVEEKQKEQKS